MNIEDLRYPIGKFNRPTEITPELRTTFISVIHHFPSKLEETVINLSNEQLDTPYRSKGWSIRQVVHHCADSHMNAFIRHKLTVSTHKPTINPYPEALWAEMADSKSLSLDSSLKIIEGLHERWTVFLSSLKDNEWKRVFFHPEHSKTISLEESAATYAWHCEHHLAHILQLKKGMNWN